MSDIVSDLGNQENVASKAMPKNLQEYLGVHFAWNKEIVFRLEKCILDCCCNTPAHAKTSRVSLSFAEHLQEYIAAPKNIYKTPQGNTCCQGTSHFNICNPKLS